MNKILKLSDYLQAESDKADTAFAKYKTELPTFEAKVKEATRRLNLDADYALSYGYTIVDDLRHVNPSTDRMLLLQRDNLVSFDFTDIPKEEVNELIAKLHSDYWNISKGWKRQREAKAKLEQDLKSWCSDRINELKLFGAHHTNTSYSCWEYKLWSKDGLDLEVEFPYNLSHEPRNAWRSIEDFRFHVLDFSLRYKNKTEQNPEPSVRVGYYSSIQQMVDDLTAKGYTMPESKAN